MADTASKDRTEILKGVMKKSRDSFGKTQSVARGPGFANKEEEDLDSRHPLTRFSGSTGGQITSSSRSKQTNTGAQSSEEPRLIFPPIVQICDKKTEMRSMKAQLENERLKYEDTYDRLKRQNEEIHQEENDFKELMMKHDETIHANLRKRREARLQALRESISKDDKDKQLAHLETEEQKQQNRKESIQRDTDNLQKYQDFLMAIWKASDGEFQDVDDVIDRFKRFRETFFDLGQREESNAIELEELKKIATTNYEKRNNEILKLTNELNSTQKEIEEMQEESLKWDNKLNELQIASSNKNLLLGQITMGIDNLFYVINKYIKIRRGNEDTIAKLDKIESFMADLWEIVQDVPHRVTDVRSLETFNKEQKYYKSRDVVSSGEDGEDGEDDEIVKSERQNVQLGQKFRRKPHQLRGISSTLSRFLLQSKQKLGSESSIYIGVPTNNTEN